MRSPFNRRETSKAKKQALMTDKQRKAADLVPAQWFSYHAQHKKDTKGLFI